MTDRRADLSGADLPEHAVAPGPSRRAVLAGLAAAGVASVAGLAGPRPAAAAPGTGTTYRIDLGGYNGPELTDKPVTLRFMRQDFTPAVNALFDDMYARFSKAYPNITVKEEKVPYGDLPRKLQLYVTSGDAPDIMMGRMDFGHAYPTTQARSRCRCNPTSRRRSSTTSRRVCARRRPPRATSIACRGNRT